MAIATSSAVTGVLIVEWSLPGLPSPGVCTVPVLLTDGTAAASTETVTVMLDEPPGAMPAGAVQLTVFALALQLHPGPVAET